ncbi:MAG TPA: efflux RND transporter periplasmic adaptor subunit [Smithella sp.]|nr:efflux RND transporter periplasmic adaptor subunit [Smithella sp.]
MNAGFRRKLFIICIILIVVILLVYGFLPGAQQVDLVGVMRGPLQITIEEEGRTRLKERFTISAPTAGYVRRINAKVGDPVKKGQIVATLEPLPSQALDPRSRATAEAAVSSAEASLKAAMERERVTTADAGYIEKRLERLKTLFAKGSISKDQFDQIDSEAQKVRALQRSTAAEVNVAKSELERAKITLQTFSAVKRNGNQEASYVVSPVNGVVYKIYHESEGPVNMGEPLMDVGNNGNLEVRVEVLSSDAVKIKQGTEVLFKRWGNDEPLTGKVRRVEPAGFTKVSSLGVEEQRVLAIVDITSPPEKWRALGDGYRMEAHFIIWEGKNILQVPASAVFRLGNQWAVFVEEKGKARKRVVELGQRNGLAAEILSGLKENEMVVAYPDDSINEGTKIRQRK